MHALGKHSTFSIKRLTLGKHSTLITYFLKALLKDSKDKKAIGCSNEQPLACVICRVETFFFSIISLFIEVFFFGMEYFLLLSQILFLLFF